jgi:hypothetical protein
MQKTAGTLLHSRSNEAGRFHASVATEEEASKHMSLKKEEEPELLH